MTENAKPDFTIVDRRQASQTEEAPPAEAQAAQPTATPASASDVEAPETVPTPESVSSADPEPTPEEEPYGMPDPAMLIAMAAMQTSPQELLGLLAPAFDSQARHALGLIADMQTGEIQEDMDTAKVAIDAVQFCLTKAESTIDTAQYREMMRRLNDLRLTYVAKQKTS